MAEQVLVLPIYEEMERKDLSKVVQLMETKVR